MELPKNTDINKYAIKFVDSKEPLYVLIYALSLVELETLKTYIKIYLKTGLIWPSKSPLYAPIILIRSLMVVLIYLWIAKA